MSRKILVAYDGSEYSQKAIIEAVKEMEAQSNAELHVVTVAEKVGPQTNKAMSEAFTDDVFKDAQKKLKEAEAYLKNNQVSFVSKVIQNDVKENPGRTVCKYAEEHSIDRIIVGCRGLRNIKSFFLGSVSHEIVQRAECPVLIIK